MQATASDLVFAGEMNGDFNAFDARSGAKLWSHHFDRGVCSPPISYRVKGVQYVAVGANGCRGGHVPLGTPVFSDEIAIFPDHGAALASALGDGVTAKFDAAKVETMEFPIVPGVVPWLRACAHRWNLSFEPNAKG